jgi:hypothetical protein
MPTDTIAKQTYADEAALVKQDQGIVIAVFTPLMFMAGVVGR